MSFPFPLFTSIKPPGGRDELVHIGDCIASWRAAGFTPVAVNGPSEIQALRGSGLAVEFAPLPTDGKPRIAAILDAVRESGASVAGIINSDCSIIGYPGNIASNLAAGLPGRAVLAWRLDVGGNAEPAAEPHGLDAFFFDTAHVPSDDAGFTIGSAFWDTWFPVALAAAGAKIGKLDLPLIVHRRHPVAWNRAAWLDGAERGWTAFRASRHDAPEMGIPNGWWRQERLNGVRLIQLGQIVCAWIRHQPADVSLLPPELAEIEAALRLGGRAMLTAGRAAEIQNSISWRITAPLRAATGLVRGWRRRNPLRCSSRIAADGRLYLTLPGSPKTD